MPEVLLKSFPYLLRGAVQTLWLSAASIALAFAAGLLIGLLGLCGPKPLRVLAAAYVLCFRAVPVLVLMFLAYYMMPGIGFSGDAYVAVLAALAVYGAAFAAEITRGAVLAVPRGQTEAAAALGLRSPATLWLVVAPQALRLSVPSLLNLAIVLVKSTAYAAIVGAWELAFAAREIVERTLAPFEVFTGVMLIYFAICYPLSVAARRLEAHLARGTSFESGAARGRAEEAKPARSS